MERQDRLVRQIQRAAQLGRTASGRAAQCPRIDPEVARGRHLAIEPSHAREGSGIASPPDVGDGLPHRREQRVVERRRVAAPGHVLLETAKVTHSDPHRDATQVSSAAASSAIRSRYRA